MINADKVLQWKADVMASVDMYNDWFMRFAPATYLGERVQATKSVEQTLRETEDLRNLTPEDLKAHPGILPTLRMATAPPLARDRLVGLSHTPKALVQTLEQGIIPTQMSVADLDPYLQRICQVLTRLLDRGIFPWLEGAAAPTNAERTRASSIVADRLCGSCADPIIRNAQESRQLQKVREYLAARGYAQEVNPAALATMAAGTFGFRKIAVGTILDEHGQVCLTDTGNPKQVRIPVDIVIQPHTPRPNGLPILIEAKSAGDFTNTNKRRKEEATKLRQLRATYGSEVSLVLFLCGYFDTGYLGYEAAEGLDWIWEHRIEDIDQLGI